MSIVLLHTIVKGTAGSPRIYNSATNRVFHTVGRLCVVSKQENRKKKNVFFVGRARLLREPTYFIPFFRQDVPRSTFYSFISTQSSIALFLVVFRLGSSSNESILTRDEYVDFFGHRLEAYLVMLNVSFCEMNAGRVAYEGPPTASPLIATSLSIAYSYYIY